MPQLDYLDQELEAYNTGYHDAEDGIPPREFSDRLRDAYIDGYATAYRDLAEIMTKLSTLYNNAPFDESAEHLKFYADKVQIQYPPKG